MLEGLLSKSVKSLLLGYTSNTTTHMLHLRFATERLDAIIEVSHNTRVLYAHDALLGHDVEACGGRVLHSIWLDDHAWHISRTLYSNKQMLVAMRLVVVCSVMVKLLQCMQLYMQVALFPAAS